MVLSCLTGLALRLNTLLDSGKQRDITQEEVREHIEAGDILSWLTQRIGGDIDLGLLTPEMGFGVRPGVPDVCGLEWFSGQIKGARFSEKNAKDLVDALQRTANVVTHKWNLGLSYLLDLVIIIIASKEWTP